MHEQNQLNCFETNQKYLIKAHLDEFVPVPDIHRAVSAELIFEHFGGPPQRALILTNIQHWKLRTY